MSTCTLFVECYVTNLFAQDPISSSGYPMITYTHPIASLTLVARQLQYSCVLCVCVYTLLTTTGSTTNSEPKEVASRLMSASCINIWDL